MMLKVCKTAVGKNISLLPVKSLFVDDNETDNCSRYYGKQIMCGSESIK